MRLSEVIALEPCVPKDDRCGRGTSPIRSSSDLSTGYRHAPQRTRIATMSVAARSQSTKNPCEHPDAGLIPGCSAQGWCVIEALRSGR